MDDIIRKLAQLGFTAYEAKAYLALLQKNPAIGYEVSKIAGIPTAKIYETLKGLKNKGVVLSSASEPVLYSPIDPDALLKRIHGDFDAKIDDLNGLLHRVTPIPDIDITWNLSGYPTVIEKIAGVIQNAAKELLVSLWPQEAEAAEGPLRAAEQRGVAVIAGIFGPCNLGLSRTINLEYCGNSSRKRLGKRLNVAVGDSKEVVIGEIGTHEDASGIWTTTPCVVLTAKEYVKHDIWGKALIDELGTERFEAMCRDNEILSHLMHTR